MRIKPYDDLIWHTADGRDLPFYAMSTEHLQNAKAWLDRNALGVKAALEMEMLGEWPDDQFDALVDQVFIPDANTWVRSTPAYGAVVHELRKRGLVDNMRAAINRMRRQHRFAALKEAWNSES